MLSIKLEQYSGPLDLLLKLIEKEELDITQISIASIADQFIARIKTSPDIRPEEMADFLIMAARLLLIKSKALFPFLRTEADEEIEELEQQLKLYKEFRDAAKAIEALIGKKKFMFAREFNRKAILGQYRKFSPPQSLNKDDMPAIIYEILERLSPAEELEEKKMIAVVSIEEKIALIEKEASSRLKFAFSRLLANSQDKIEIIVSFLAVLELIKQRVVTVEQTGLFEEIEIFQNNC